MDDVNFDNRVYEVSAPGFGERLARKLRAAGHALSVIPFVGPYLATIIAPSLVASAAALEAGSSLAEGKFSKAFKQTTSGAIDTVVTAFVAPANWWINLGSAVFTTDTLGEHAHKITNWAMDSADDLFLRRHSAPAPTYNDVAKQMLLGPAPYPNSSVVAGVGYGMEKPQIAPVANAPQTMAFTDREADRRGVDPETLRSNYLRDAENRQTYKELVSASQTAGLGSNPSRA